MSEHYKYIKIKEENNIGEITLNRSPDNSLTIDMMLELIDIHKRWANDRSIRGVIIDSQVPNYFSNGLDIAVLLKSSIDEKKEIFLTLLDMVLTIYRFSKPHICLVRGHAMAGGAVLASLSDFRYMADGPYRFSFSEIKIGLSMPSQFIKIVKSITGDHYIRRVVLMGEALKPDSAYEVGLVDSVVEGQKLKTMARKQLVKIFMMPVQSFKKTKMIMREEVIQELESGRADILSSIADNFDDNFQEGLTAIQERRRPRFSLD